MTIFFYENGELINVERGVLPQEVKWLAEDWQSYGAGCTVIVE